MSAKVLVEDGLRVAMIERGSWVPRDASSWAVDGSLDLTPFYNKETQYHVLAGGNRPFIGPYACVGGPSVFYGGVSLRLREGDFEPSSEIDAEGSARWPVSYEAFSPYYDKAEEILDVAGEPNGDPTAPSRDRDYPQRPARLSHASTLIANAAQELGLNPFRLPLAINYRNKPGRRRCISCRTCDTFACAIEAKNDLATCVIPDLMAKGMHLSAETVVTELLHKDGRVFALRCYDKKTGRYQQIHADVFVLAAGAIASPHLLLASDLHLQSPATQHVGSNLMRHCNGIVLGLFSQKPDPKVEFHKQVAIHDFYFGSPMSPNGIRARGPKGKWGSIQQLSTPPSGLVKSMLPPVVRDIVGGAIEYMTGLLVIAEDQPQQRNFLRVNPDKRDRFGLPELEVTHHYSSRDHQARAALKRQARRVLKEAGAFATYFHQIKTFSHALGTVRFGDDPKAAPLDRDCRFRGIENLYLTDASFMPTSAAVNPSLTVSANALRVAEGIVRGKEK